MLLDLQVVGADASDRLEDEPNVGVTSDRLAEVWPQVSERLMRLLDKRGLSPSQAEDVCQDVAVRVLSSEVVFDTAEDLYRWAAHVARNLHVDLLRATSRVQCDEDALHGIPADTDVEHEVERRIALSKVLRQWLTLRPADRAALLEGMYAETEGDRTDAVRRAVRRHRARQRLRLLTKGAFGWAIAVRWVRNARPTSPQLVQAASIAAVAPMVLLVVAPFRGAPPAPSVPPTTVRGATVLPQAPPPRAVVPAAAPRTAAAPVARPVQVTATAPAEVPKVDRPAPTDGIAGNSVGGPGREPGRGGVWWQRGDRRPTPALACVGPLVGDPLCFDEPGESPIR